MNIQTVAFGADAPAGGLLEAAETARSAAFCAPVAIVQPQSVGDGSAAKSGRGFRAILLCASGEGDNRASARTASALAEEIPDAAVVLLPEERDLPTTLAWQMKPDDSVLIAGDAAFCDRVRSMLHAAEARW